MYANAWNLIQSDCYKSYLPEFGRPSECNACGRFGTLSEELEFRKSYRKIINTVALC
jgi:hypothetical protein